MFIWVKNFKEHSNQIYPRSCLSASGMINASNCCTSDACCLFEGGIFCFCDPEALKGSV